MTSDNDAFREIIERVKGITWTPNEHGEQILICPTCLMELFDDEGRQIPVVGPVMDIVTASLTHANLYHHD